MLPELVVFDDEDRPQTMKVPPAALQLSEVYALGVILFELLTGRLPHRRKATTPAGLASEVTTESIERPPAAVRRETVAGEARQRLGPVDRDRLSRRLRGDLDWIVLRALAREPERRYPSAAALGADLARHLEGLPVAARPDTLGYRTRVPKHPERGTLMWPLRSAVAPAHGAR